MTSRRKFLAGVGALVGGSATAIGTGAFTSGSTERDVVINTASGDASGYIGLEALNGPNGVFVDQDGSSGGGLSVSFGDTAVGGDGVNEDGEFLFDNLFQIRNQGTQPTWVWTEGGGSIKPYVMDGEGMGGDGDRRAIEVGSADQGEYHLGPRGMAFHYFVGEKKNIGFEVNTSGVATDSDIGGQLNVFATAIKSNVPNPGGFDVQNAP